MLGSDTVTDNFTNRRKVRIKSTSLWLTMNLTTEQYALSKNE